MGRVLGVSLKFFLSDEFPVRRRLSLVTLHVAFLLVAFCGSVLIRFEFDYSSLEQYLRLAFVIPFLVISLIVLQLHKQLFGWWRYTSIHDLTGIIRASAESQVLFMIYMVLVYRLGAYPRSLYILNFILMVFLIGGGRLFTRYAWEVPLYGKPTGGKSTVLIGAGEAGQMMVREMRKNPALWMNPVAFVDDNHEKIGLRFQGIKVMGSIDQLPEVVSRTGAELAIIAMAYPSAKLMSRIMGICQDADIDVRVVHGLTADPDGQLRISHIKKVQVGDLLGRQQLDLSDTAIEENLRGRKILVTGGAGSIGSEIGRQLIQFKPEVIILFDNTENSLFYVENELNGRPDGPKIITYLGDVTDENDLARAFSKYRPDVVFHAAAYKHVPIAESNPFQVIKNNVLGTWRTINASKAYGVEQFVLISTDKAVNPENIMGATKRIAELMVHYLSYRPNRSCAVRFGNVLDSAGSVVPIFRRMISRGGPVKVTHPDIERYFMTIPEAVQLVLQTTTMNMTGDVFVLDMGEPVNIMDLARKMIKLSGLEPEKDIEILVTGLRPGEKLEEILYSEEEEVTASRHSKISRITSNSHDKSKVEANIAHLIGLIMDGDETEAISKVAALSGMRVSPEPGPGLVETDYGFGLQENLQFLRD